MKFDSIVIGSGLSGLSCALLLARRGRRVVVLEQHPQPAPVVRGFSREGLYFDSGFHYAGGLGDDGAFRPLFRHLGLESKLELFPFTEDGFDRLRISATGETLSLPFGYTKIKEMLGQRFPAAQARIVNYFDEIAHKWSCFPYLDLETDIADFGKMSVHENSLHDRLMEFSDYPELQSLLSMHSLLYGIPPEEAPETLNMQVAGSYYHSVHGICGGGRALVEAFLELLTAAGVEVRCRAEVTALLAGPDKVRGVQLASGEEIFATEVVATMNPALLPQWLPEGILRPAYLKRLKRLRQTSSAYIVFAKSHRSLDILHHRNLFVQARAGMFGVNTDCPLHERPFYLTAADQGREGGSHGLIGIVPTNYTEVAEWGRAETKCSPAYHKQKLKVSEQLLKLFVENCPELDGLEVLELATPLTLRDFSLAPEGAIYGVGHFLGQYNPHPVTRLPGLFLSGQAIAAPGLMGTVVAAYLTCGSILGHESLRREIRLCR